MKIVNKQDTIFLSDLRVRTLIGINDWERRVRQTVAIDLFMPADAALAASSDSIEDTLNYKAVAKRIISFVGESQFQLVETLAEHIAGIIIKEFDAPWVEVTVHKPGAVRGAQDVGISIRRGSAIGDQREVYVGVGSNMDADKHLNKAITAIRKRFGAIRQSTVYRNAAVGFEGDEFLNMVIGLTTSEPIEAVAAALAKIEKQCGRQRSSKRFGPRRLDLDLLLFGQRVLQTDEIHIPRPDLMRSAYVLRPLAELAGPVMHPVAGCTLQELWDNSELRDHTMTPVLLKD